MLYLLSTDVADLIFLYPVKAINPSTLSLLESRPKMALGYAYIMSVPPNALLFRFF